MTTSFLCQNSIEFDAMQGYQADDVIALINRIDQDTRSTVVLLKNAHYLTARAFDSLYNYIQHGNSKHVIFALVSSDKSKIFPPLLDHLESA